MDTNERNDAELAMDLKDLCTPPATPDRTVEAAVWQQVNKRLHAASEPAPAAPRAKRIWRWWLAASTVAAGLLIAVMLSGRHDPSWEMASQRASLKAPIAEGTASTKTSPDASASKADMAWKERAERSKLVTNEPVPEYSPSPVEHPVATHNEKIAEDNSAADIRDDHDSALSAPKIMDVPLGGHGFTPAMRMKAREEETIRRAPVPSSSNLETGSSASVVPTPASTSPASGPVLAPPAMPAEPIGEKKPVEPGDLLGKKVEEEPSARDMNEKHPADGLNAMTDESTGKVLSPSPVKDGSSPRDVYKKPVEAGREIADTRGKTVEQLKAEAADLKRQIDEAERARKPVTRRNPYANLQEINPNVPVLTGGVQDDNAEFGKFLSFLRQTNAPDAIRLPIDERVMIEVADVNGLPLTNADVRIQSNGQIVHKARTYANGVALFHPEAVRVDGQAQEFRVEIVPPPGCQGQLVVQTFRGRSGTWRVQVPYARSQQVASLDILFCLDCTGSMADEIERIQKTLQMMVAKFNALPGKPLTRWGLVQYRDRKDQYVTQVHDFTPDVAQFQKRLDECKADAGGDEPESVNEALDKAVEGVSWNRGDAIRLVLLVGDAPPHMDYQDDVKYTESMAKAQRRAIKIYPLAASGLNKNGEVIFRQLAQYTLARFLFISYGGSTPHQVSNPGQSNNLDDLIVHVVASEVNARATPISKPVQIEDPDRWQR